MEESKLFNASVPEWTTGNEEMLLKIKKEVSEDMYEEEFNDKAILETKMEWEDEAILDTKMEISISIKQEELDSIEETEEIISKTQLKTLELYSCEMCTKKYKSKFGLRKHLLKPHDFYCSRCEFQTTNKTNLAIHLRKHDDHYEKCKFCPFSSLCLDSLETHILSKHMKEYQGRMKVEIESGHTSSEKRLELYSCSLCSEKFQLRSDLLQHKQSVHETKNQNANYIMCNFCPFSTVDPQCLEWHILTKHKKEHLKLYSCSSCSNKYQSRSDLQLHIKSFHKKENLKKYNCVECQFETTSRKSYLQHKKEHDDKFKKCEFCPFSTLLPECLESHIHRKHNKDNPEEETDEFESDKKFKCEICPFQTVHRTSISVHMKNHKRDAAYKNCKFCPFSTLELHSLESHINRIHGKENQDANQM